jgi:hypothetical protein
MSDSFQAQFRPLLEADPRWGAVACLPWDEAIFGFPVAALNLGGAPLPAAEPLTLFTAALRDFCRETKAELVSASVPGGAAVTQSVLCAAGFVPVEFSLLAQIPHLTPARLPQPRFSLRPAELQDHDAVRRIAGVAFIAGRYHGDPRFPRALANLRYSRWIERALDTPGPGGHVFVLGPPGSVVGFMHVVIRDGHADLRLGAVDPENDLGFAGFSLYAETLRAVCALGAHSVSAKIAAANTRVLNVCAMLGFRFSNPESAFHWHAPHAPHLLPAACIDRERKPS